MMISFSPQPKHPHRQNDPDSPTISEPKSPASPGKSVLKKTQYTLLKTLNQLMSPRKEVHFGEKNEIFFIENREMLHQLTQQTTETPCCATPKITKKTKSKSKQHQNIDDHPKNHTILINKYPVFPTNMIFQPDAIQRENRILRHIQLNKMRKIPKPIPQEYFKPVNLHIFPSSPYRHQLIKAMRSIRKKIKIYTYNELGKKATKESKIALMNFTDNTADPKTSLHHPHFITPNRIECIEPPFEGKTEVCPPSTSLSDSRLFSEDPKTVSTIQCDAMKTPDDLEKKETILAKPTSSAKTVRFNQDVIRHQYVSPHVRVKATPDSSAQPKSIKINRLFFEHDIMKTNDLDDPFLPPIRQWRELIKLNKSNDVNVLAQPKIQKSAISNKDTKKTSHLPQIIINDKPLAQPNSIVILNGKPFIYPDSTVIIYSNHIRYTNSKAIITLHQNSKIIISGGLPVSFPTNKVMIIFPSQNFADSKISLNIPSMLPQVEQPLRKYKTIKSGILKDETRPKPCKKVRFANEEYLKIEPPLTYAKRPLNQIVLRAPVYPRNEDSPCSIPTPSIRQKTDHLAQILQFFLNCIAQIAKFFQKVPHVLFFLITTMINAILFFYMKMIKIKQFLSQSFRSILTHVESKMGAFGFSFLLRATTAMIGINLLILSAIVFGLALSMPTVLGLIINTALLTQTTLLTIQLVTGFIIGAEIIASGLWYFYPESKPTSSFRYR